MRSFSFALRLLSLEKISCRLEAGIVSVLASAEQRSFLVTLCVGRSTARATAQSVFPRLVVSCRSSAVMGRTRREFIVLRFLRCVSAIDAKRKTPCRAARKEAKGEDGGPERTQIKKERMLATRRISRVVTYRST